MKKLLSVSLLLTAPVIADSLDDLMIALRDISRSHVSVMTQKIEAVLKMTQASDLMSGNTVSANLFYEKNLKDFIRDGIQNKTLDVNMAIPSLKRQYQHGTAKGDETWDNYNLLSLALQNKDYDTVEMLLNAGADYKQSVIHTFKEVDNGEKWETIVHIPTVFFVPLEPDFILLATDKGIDLSVSETVQAKSDKVLLNQIRSRWTKIGWNGIVETIPLLMLMNYYKTHGSQLIKKDFVVYFYEEKDLSGNIIRSQKVTMGDEINSVLDPSFKTELEKWIE